MPNIFTLACALLPGIVPQACYQQEGKPAICADAPAGQYIFNGLAKGDYTFYCKYGAQLGASLSFSIPSQSAPQPCATPPPDFLCLECENRYQACALNNFQMNYAIGQICKTCGKKCAKVCPK